jgi:hypothetical protein
MLGGLAGMAAGYGIAKAMEHDEAPASHADNSGFSSLDTARNFDTPDYGAFDAGNGGDSWDDGGSDDSNW